MSLRLMTPIGARVITVLQDFLPAELDLIDAEESDGITTPDIRFWHAFDRKVITEYPAFSLRAASSIPTGPSGVREDGMGRRVDAVHRLDLMFHATLQNISGSEPAKLQSLMHRYVNGAMRVLCIMKDGLQTVTDPTRWGSPNATTVCEWLDEATYGPETEQEGGIVVRTATLPVRVRRIEAR